MGEGGGVGKVVRTGRSRREGGGWVGGSGEVGGGREEGEGKEEEGRNGGFIAFELHPGW